MNIFSTKLVNEFGQGDVNFIEAGIHDNVKLTEINVGKSTKGTSFIEFTFSKDGKNLKNTIWEPELFPNETQADFQERSKAVTTRLMQIFWCFYEKDSLEFSAATWDEGFNWLKEKIDAVKDDVLVRIKAVYGRPNKDGKQYVELPRYWRFTFIENMNVAESNINKLSIDDFERVKPDVETKKDSGFATFTSEVAHDGMDMLAVTDRVDSMTPLVSSFGETMPF